MVQSLFPIFRLYILEWQLPIRYKGDFVTTSSRCGSGRSRSELLGCVRFDTRRSLIRSVKICVVRGRRGTEGIGLLWGHDDFC